MRASIHLGALVERVTCRKCARPCALPQERWRDLLDAAAHDLPRMASGTELTCDVDRASGWVAARNVAAVCASCSAPLREESVERGCENGSCFCTGCGAKLLVRPVPPSLAAGVIGITHLLGEDIGQIANPDGVRANVADAAVVACPSCGGNVSADGSSHAMVCTYCRNMVVLPNDVWERLRPGSTEPHVFYLVHDDAVPRAQPGGRADFCWSRARCATGDGEGSVYVLGESAESHSDGVVFALDAQLRTKWVRRGLKHIDGESRLAWRNDGVLLVWNTRRSAATLLRCVDGSDAGKLGGEDRAGSPIHNLDLALAQDAAIDFDGTVVFLKERRLLRCAPDGTGIPIWPARSGFLGRTLEAKPSPFTGNDAEDAAELESIDDYPTTLRSGELGIGWDGCLSLAASEHFARFDRTGKKKYLVHLPESSHRSRFGADASGTAYVLRGDEDGETASIFRVAPNGSFARIVDGRQTPSPLPMPSAFLVRADGTILALGSDRVLRVFGGDGRVLWRSSAAQEEDKERADEED